MLYRGSEIMREVGWVIFDEVHYMRDSVRGVVWEETIILLPDKVRYVFLSATIPNAMQFAEWITKTHNQPCHVVYTDFRPTPLQNYLFPAGADGIHLVVDEKGTFREGNFQKAMAVIAEKGGDDPNDPNAKRKGKGKNRKINTGLLGGRKVQTDIYKIVKMIMLKNYNPVIVFSFSKRECEDYALQMSQMAFNDDAEKAVVNKVFTGAIEMLAPEDRELPQVQHILPLLKRGIGVHHSGLLPILKEVIEILFQEGLIKVLFATETFSIGLNMPAKTVVFTSVRKFDGVSQRWLTPSEYVQMSGRAGRRGLDERGIVIMMIDEKMEPAVAKEIVRGEQDKLNSAFHLGYNMILNLMRVEGISPEYMLEHCFFQFQNTASVAGMEKRLHELETDRDDIEIEDEAMVKEYYDLRQQLDLYTKDMHNVITHPNYCLQFMQSGRLVRIKYGDYDFGWGAVVNFTERKAPKGQKQETISPQQSYMWRPMFRSEPKPTLICRRVCVLLGLVRRARWRWCLSSFRVSKPLATFASSSLLTSSRATRGHRCAQLLARYNDAFQMASLSLIRSKIWASRTNHSRGCSEKLRFSSRECSQTRCTTRPDCRSYTANMLARSTFRTRSRRPRRRSPKHLQ